MLYSSTSCAGMRASRFFVFFVIASCAALVCAQPLIVAESPDRVPAVVRTWAGKAPAQPATTVPDSQIVALVVANAETMSHADSIRSGLSRLYTDLGKARPLRLGVWTAQGIQTAGPFKTRVQLQSALRELTELGASSPLSLSPEQFWSKLPPAVAQAGTSWISVLLIGRLPRLDPSLVEYASAYAGQKIRAQRIRLSFWSPGEDAGDPARAVAAATAGVVVESPELFIDVQRIQPDHYLEVDVKLPPVSRGFFLHKAALEDAQGKPLVEWLSLI